ESISRDRNLLDWTSKNITESKFLFLVPEGKETSRSDPRESSEGMKSESSIRVGWVGHRYIKASPPDSKLVRLEETSSGSTTTHADNYLPEYDSFLFEIEPDQGELTSVVMEDILGEPYVHVPNVLPTHPTLMLDSDFIPYDDSLGSDLEVSFPSGTRNKNFDSVIFFEVQSKRFLSRDILSISFIRNLLCLMIETLLLFCPKMKRKFSILVFFLLTSYLIRAKSLLIYLRAR
nr:hypothetical protein [Tanacetum cinerariifolium]